jgi:putative oxidoreductase
MLVAIFTVHSGNGLFMSNNGYEYAMSLLAVTVVLLMGGGGRYSLDATFASRSAGAR